MVAEALDLGGCEEQLQKPDNKIFAKVRGIFPGEAWDRVRETISSVQVTGDTQTTHEGLFVDLNPVRLRISEQDEPRQSNFSGCGF